MSKIADDAGSAQPPNGTGESRGSPTRGFLFADIRDYTRFVEIHGAAAAAELLARYRRIVRDAVAHFDGSEVRTEGDSFFVVFPAVSAAVQCGVEIVAAARNGGASGEPIPVGVGIHAGETVETSEGYVGGAVNVAARICAIAQPGEVLVSDTVRALTRSVLPVSFVDRGRRQLKGLADPVTVYAVVPAGAASTVTPGRWARLPRPARIGVGVAVPVIVVGLGALLVAAIRPAAGLPPGTWKIGLDMPLSGGALLRGVPIRNAVQLAIDDTNAAGGIDGSQLAIDVHDDGGDDQTGRDAALGAANATAMANDPSVVAFVGPSSSKVAAAEIPISNRAGLLECSPANTQPGLTKPRDGALDLRAAFPDRINYVRTAPSDDIQGVALASFVFTDLGAKTTLVIDDTGNGRDIADQFSTAYAKLGGTVVRRALNPGADPSTVLDPLSASDPPGAVFFGGFTDTGAWNVRAAMVANGRGSVPFVSWDGIQDGSGADKDSYIQHSGPAAAGSYFSHATIGPPRADFATRYRERFGKEPDEYSASAYACTQVIVDSLRAIAAKSPRAAEVREAVRAYAVDPSHRYDTVIGTVGFDVNGDSRQQYVTFYKVDMSAQGGLGDWVVAKQQDYGPAP